MEYWSSGRNKSMAHCRNTISLGVGNQMLGKSALDPKAQTFYCRPSAFAGTLSRDVMEVQLLVSCCLMVSSQTLRIKSWAIRFWLGQHRYSKCFQTNCDECFAVSFRSSSPTAAGVNSLSRRFLCFSNFNRQKENTLQIAWVHQHSKIIIKLFLSKLIYWL